MCPTVWYLLRDCSNAWMGPTVWYLLRDCSNAWMGPTVWYLLRDCSYPTLEKNISRRPDRGTYLAVHQLKTVYQLMTGSWEVSKLVVKTADLREISDLLRVSGSRCQIPGTSRRGGMSGWAPQSGIASVSARANCLRQLGIIPQSRWPQLAQIRPILNTRLRSSTPHNRVSTG